MDQHAAIHINGGTGDIGGEIGGQKQINACDIGGLAQSTQGNTLDDFGFHRVGQFVAGNIGGDQTGSNGIDTDMIRPQFTRHGFGQTHHTRFGCAD